MMGKEPTQTVESYISQFNPESQERLQTIRRLVKEICPQAEETISYGIPTFKFHGNLVHMAAYQNHLGFYPGPTGIEFIRDQLLDYKLSKGTIQFPNNRELPLEIIREIISYRKKEQELFHNKESLSLYNAVEGKKIVVPKYIVDALESQGVLVRFSVRPSYQQKEYIHWINRSDNLEKKEARLSQMIKELSEGEDFMGEKE